MDKELKMFAQCINILKENKNCIKTRAVLKKGARK